MEHSQLTEHLTSTGFTPIEYTRNEYQWKVVCVLSDSDRQKLIQEASLCEIPDFFTFHNGVMSIVCSLNGCHVRRQMKSPEGDDLEYTAHKVWENGTSHPISSENNENYFTTPAQGFQFPYPGSTFLKNQDLSVLNQSHIHDALISWWYEFVPYPKGNPLNGYAWPMCYVFRTNIAERMKRNLQLDAVPIFAQVRNGKLVGNWSEIKRSDVQKKIRYNLFSLQGDWVEHIPQAVSWSKKRCLTAQETKSALKIESGINIFETREWVYILKKHIQQYLNSK